MAPANVVIVGASVAGLKIAHSLLEVPDVKVVLINPATTYYWNIAAPRIVAKPNAFKTEQYLLPIKDAFNKYPKESFEFIVGTATAVDVSSKTVSVTPTDGSAEATSVSYDYLVLASGSTTPSTTGDINGTSIPFKQSNRDDMKQLIAAAQQKIAGAKEIVIGGAGPIGVELAGELAEAAEETGNKVSITLVSATDRVLPMLKPGGSSAAEKLLKDKKVKVVTSTRVTGAEASGDQWAVSLDNGEKLTADLYIPTTGVVPNNSFIPDQFLDKDGWVKVDKELRVSDNIYAAGDITNNSMRLSFKAAEQAGVAANNLKADILGKGERKTFDQGESIMMVVPVGGSGGTGQIFGMIPFSFMVKMIKGKDYFISKAAGAVTGKL